MARISGLWVATQGSQSGAIRQGSGVNPIHAVRYGAGRNTTPEPILAQVDPGLTDEFAPDNLGYMDEDQPSQLWGYGVETGTADHARWEGDARDEDARQATLEGYPSYGPYKGGSTGGTAIRAVEHGAHATVHQKVNPEDNPAMGWLNKEHSFVNDSDQSDPSQLFMQTSMSQRDQTRAGSQSSGTASEYDAPIRQTISAMSAYTFSGESRHVDMLPKSQDLIIKPFWLRTAGTGNPALMEPNAMYVTTPMQRTPPGDPFQGQDVSMDTSSGGYSYEDVTW